MNAQAGRALAQVAGFERARVGPLLADGPASTSWRVEQGGATWVLRLDKPEAVSLGLDRRNEREVAAAVARAGLTPAYRHFDPSAGIALRPFAEGRPWTPADLLNTDRLVALAGALRALHRVSASGREYDPLGAARRYARQVGNSAAARGLERVVAAWSAVPRGGGEPVVCHNDLVADNILQTPGGVMLIDWEYAGRGDGLFDLAVVLEHHGLGADRAETLLSAYLQREPRTPERNRLAALRRCYAALLDLWQLRTAPP